MVRVRRLVFLASLSYVVKTKLIARSSRSCDLLLVIGWAWITQQLLEGGLPKGSEVVNNLYFSD
jgi:hypothetical protein